MSQQYRYPESAVVSLSAEGQIGAVAPTTALQVAGQDPTGDLAVLELDASGNLLVSHASFPTSLGQKTMAQSFPVVIASDQSAVNVSAAQSGTWNINNISGVISLPTGASTAANQVSEIALLTTIDSDTSAIVLSSQNVSDATGVDASPVPTRVIMLGADNGGNVDSLTSDGSGRLNVAVGSSALPTGAATAANQATEIASLASIDGKLPLTLGQKAMAASLAVVLASDQSAIPVSQSGTWNINNISGTISLPTGAATEATLSAISGKLPATLGQKTMSNSLAVVLASDQSSVPISQSGRSKANNPVRNVYSSVNVTTAAYVELVASLTSTANYIEIFDSSGQTLVIAFGAAASEVDQFNVFPGGNGPIPINIPAGTRVSIKAVSATANVGEIDINFYT